MDRDLLLDLLWNVRQIHKARHSLSQLLYTSKKLLPDGLLSVSANQVALRLSPENIDYCRFKDALRRGDYQESVETYVGKFLDRLPYISDEFEDWRISAGALVESEALDAHYQLIGDAIDQEDYGTAATVARRALVLRPLDARLGRVRVECLANSGDVRSALRELEGLRRHHLMESGAVPQVLSAALSDRITRLASLPETPPEGGVHIPLVGRSQELQKLNTCWRASNTGCRIAVISGEPGIGKTRILQHALRRTVLEGARAYSYDCGEVETRLPYSTIVGLLREGMKDADNTFLTDRWQSALASLAPELFPEVAANPGESQRILWEAVAQYFACVSKAGPVVISIDNYQWADDRSRELLVYATKRWAENPIFIVLASRSHVPAATYEDDRGNLTNVALAELPDQLVCELIERYEQSFGLEVTPENRSLILQSIGGRPFFLLEVLRHLRQTESATTLHSLGEVASASRISEYLGRRLASITPSSRSLVHAAAILNRDAPLHIFARMTGLAAVVAADAVAELVEQGIFSQSTSVGFAHDLMREVAVEMVPLYEKPLWHAKAAEALSESGAAAAHEIAFHWEAGGERKHAYRYARIAVSESVRLHAYLEAEEQYRRLVRCAPSSQRLAIVAEFAKFLADAGQYRKIVPLLSDLQESVSKAPNKEIGFLLALGQFHVRENKAAALSELVEQAKALLALAEEHAPNRIATALWYVANHVRHSKEDELLARFADMLIDYSRSTSDGGDVEIQTMAALLTAATYGHQRATPLAEMTVQRAEAWNRPLDLLRALFARGTVALWSGALRKANDDYTRALSIAEEFDAEQGIPLRANYAVVLLEQGRLSEAERYGKMSLQETRFDRRAYAYFNLALIKLRQGDNEAATHYARALLDTNEPCPEPWVPVHAHAILGMIELAEGKNDSAIQRGEYVDRALALAEGIGDVTALYVLCARLECLAARPNEALKRLDSAVQAVYAKDYLAGARLDLEIARIHCASKNWPVAREIVSPILQHAIDNDAFLLAEEAYKVLSSIPNSSDGDSARELAKATDRLVLGGKVS